MVIIGWKFCVRNYLPGSSENRDGLEVFLCRLEVLLSLVDIVLQILDCSIFRKNTNCSQLF